MTDYNTVVQSHRNLYYNRILHFLVCLEAVEVLTRVFVVGLLCFGCHEKEDLKHFIQEWFHAILPLNRTARAVSVHHLHTFISNPFAVLVHLFWQDLTECWPTYHYLPHITFKKECSILVSATFLVTSDTFCTFSVHWWNDDLKIDSDCDVTTYT